ncbi:MAG: acylphosphatase [Fusobacteriaceae bacterium]
MKSYKYVVKGRVQGVGYRYFVNYTAEKLGIKGTVKNLENGDVEVLAQGDELMIKDFESYLKIGPKFSKVSKIEKNEFEKNEFSDFVTIY